MGLLSHLRLRLRRMLRDEESRAESAQRQAREFLRERQRQMRRRREDETRR